MRQILTSAELAELLGVSRRWVQREAKHGGLPCHRIGSHRKLLRFDLDEVLAWVADGGRDPRPDGDES